VAINKLAYNDSIKPIVLNEITELETTSPELNDDKKKYININKNIPEIQVRKNVRKDVRLIHANNPIF